MKRQTAYKINHKHLQICTWLMAVIALIILLLLMIVKADTQVDFFTFIQSDLIYNTLYILAMFEAICFFEMFYIAKSLKKNQSFENSILNLFLISMAHIFLMNLIVGILILMFIRKTLKENKVTMRILLKNTRKQMLKVSLCNFVFLTCSLTFIYSLIIYRF